MRTVVSFFVFIITISTLSVCLSSCTKNDDSMPIQQGDSLVEINAVYPQSNWLQVRYNKVLNVPVNLTIAFYLNDGSKKTLDFTLPAGFYSPENFGPLGGDDYLNVWNYSYDSGVDTLTGNSTGATGPKIYWDADVDSIKIVKASCTDSRYGFKVLSGEDQWHYLIPADPKTVLSFVANEDTIQYSDYDFAASTTWFHTSSSSYSFYVGNALLIMGTDASTYPFQTGSVILIPFVLYNWMGMTKGSQPDGPEVGTNGSTLQLTITRMDDKTYDGTFSGKVWSSRQTDTLYFTNGVIENALLPTEQQ